MLHDVEDMHVRKIISDAYNPEKSYAVGDYCIRDNTLYKCIEETTDVWNSTSWEATNVGSEVSGLTNSLSNLKMTRINVGGDSTQTYEYTVGYYASILVIGRPSRSYGAIYLITNNEVLQLSGIGENLPIVTATDGVLSITNNITSVILGMLLT